MTPQQGLFIFCPSDSSHYSIPGRQRGRGWGSRSPGDWRDCPQAMHTGAASPHASYPSQIPKPLMGSRLRGATRKRGAPPGSLPTASSSGTSPEGRDPRVGAREPPSREG